MKLIFINIFLFAVLISLNAQEKIGINYVLKSETVLPKLLKQKKFFNAKEKAEQSLKQTLYKLYNLGFIEASIDSFSYEQDVLNAYLFLGEKYMLTALENGNLQEEVVRKVKFQELKFSNKTFSFQEIEQLQYDVLNFYENRGYPFAEVYLDSFFIADKQIVSKIYVKQNELFVIDTIIVEGNTKTKSRYLQNYLSIKKDDFYNKAKIESISEKLAQLPFLNESEKAKVYFENGKASIYVYLAKQKSNQFNALLGIAPNSSLTKNKVNITGDVKLHLRNSFGVGEEIYLDFKQLKPRTQNLDLKLNYPFLLNLPFGLKAAFSLYKNDTSFLNLNSKAGVHYHFNGADFIQLYYENKTSNVLNYDTTKVRRTNALPEILDLSDNRFGLKLHFQKLDYILNPRKGYNISISGALGTKKIIENGTLKTINENIYENINSRSINFSLETYFEYNIPILKRHSFLLSNQSSFFISKNILENEKFRIGGANLLRGFDEDAIYSPFYSLFTLEYHFLLSKNTYFYTFGDMALVEDARFNNGTLDTPFGFGIGAALETKGGIFSLSYALGKQFDNKIELRNGKIHFGYINLF